MQIGQKTHRQKREQGSVEGEGAGGHGGVRAVQKQVFRKACTKQKRWCKGDINKNTFHLSSLSFPSCVPYLLRATFNLGVFFFLLALSVCVSVLFCLLDRRIHERRYFSHTDTPPPLFFSLKHLESQEWEAVNRNIVVLPLLCKEQTNASVWCASKYQQAAEYSRYICRLGSVLSVQPSPSAPALASPYLFPPLPSSSLAIPSNRQQGFLSKWACSSSNLCVLHPFQ